jgi:hypothetical protein
MAEVERERALPRAAFSAIDLAGEKREKLTGWLAVGGGTEERTALNESNYETSFNCTAAGQCVIPHCALLSLPPFPF